VGGELGQGVDPNQLKDVFIGERKAENEAGFIVGPKSGVCCIFYQEPGTRFMAGSGGRETRANTMQPYVAEHSLNLYARLGTRIAFLGVDARTEVNDLST